MDAQPRTFGNKAAQQRDAGTLLRSPDLEPQGFTSVPNWLKDVHGLSHHSKLAFVYLLQYSWQDGQCFPGLDTLASDLEVERHTASRYLKELEVAGLIRIERRGQGLTNVYHLLAWRPSDGLDGTNSCHQGEQEGTETCHQGNQDGTEMYHLDGTGMHHPDGTKPCHNKDSVTKTQITTTGTPVVMSNKVDTRAEGSNYNPRARAREDSPEQFLDEDALRPPADWVPAIAQQIQEHWGGNLLPKEREEWREWVWQNLHGEDPAQRKRFLAYAFDNNYIPQLSSPRGVLTFLGKDIDSWRRSGRPAVKGLRRAEGGKTAPKVPAHIQREHDLSYKPRSRKIDATSSPEEIAGIVAQLRKGQGGEERAQKWLRSIGLASEGA